MKRTSYKDWLKINNIKEKEIIDEPCEFCNGLGGTECEYCGTVLDCEECNGKGTIEVNKTREEYDLQFLRDDDKIKNFKENIKI